jgi:murein DD-endopeptidase MepM/ murein hydrolase activator NlpD
MRRVPILLLLLVTFIVQRSAPGASATVPLADGFDFPVGPPDAEGYYKSRGFRTNHHMGDDWNGVGGGNSDYGAPVHAVAHGIVVYARDARMGWGNLVVIRHAYLEGGTPQVIDSVYAHLNRFTVREGQQVRRGQLVGGIGSNRGMYTAHLHFEIRKNLRIGPFQGQFARDFSNYHDPTRFISGRRRLPGAGRTTSVSLDIAREAGGLEGPAGSVPGTPKPSTQPPAKRGFQINRFEDLGP